MQIVIDDILTNYEVFGEKNSKTIFILHGWGQNISNWLVVAGLLSDKFKVILLDLPGFGSSSLPTKSFDIFDYYLFVNKFIQRMDLHKFILVGHSMGGKISIILAANPNKIDQLILISPSGIDKQSYFIKIKIYIFRLFKSFIFLLPMIYQEKIRNFFSSEDYKESGALRDSFKKIVSKQVIPEAKKIETKTLIIWGELDKEVNLKTSKILKRLISKSLLRIIWGHGHSLNIECPDKLASLILEYI